MATRAQAKAAIDAAVIDAKADIDALPASTNIKDGGIAFGPTRYQLILDAGGVLATATSLQASIEAFLTAQSRPFVTSRLYRRAEDNPRVITITEAKLSVRITNF